MPRTRKTRPYMTPRCCMANLAAKATQRWSQPLPLEQHLKPSEELKRIGEVANILRVFPELDLATRLAVAPFLVQR